ncbi:MAG: TonB-dependent receptor [candidate division Zixibacteria bacterium]|nr:TonB-dependent receptor [candidate division Zixibacteria bacterium]
MGKHSKIFYLLTALIGLMLLTSGVNAANIGKISGKVVDRDTGEPLPTVAVSVEGTDMGALTDINGQYVILNVPVGEYSIKASLVGYQPVIKQGVFVSVDLTTYVDFELTSKAIDIGEIQVVQAERPLVIKDQTSTLRLVSGDEARNMPTRGYQDVVGLSTGVVAFQDNSSVRQRGGNESSNSPTLNIRGGRQNEVAYLVDGFATSDPLTGLANLSVNNNAIEEISITTGGFNAEYGWIASGAINVTTKEGTKNYSGNLEAVTSELTDEYGYNIYAFDLTGPIIPGNERASFFVSGERRVHLDRQPHAKAGDEPLPHNDLRGWTWQGKLRYDLNQAMNLRLGVIGSYDKWNRYIRSYHFNTAHAPKYEDVNNSVNLQFTHNVSKQTFYTVRGAYFLTKRTSGDGVYFDDLWGYIRPKGNKAFDATTLFRTWDDPETYYQVCCPGNTWCSEPLGPNDSIPDDAPCSASELTYRYDYYLLSNDEGNYVDSSKLDESYVLDDFTKRRSSYYGFDFDLTHQLNKANEIKVGFEYQRHTLRYLRHVTPIQLYNGPGVGTQDMDNYGYDLEFQYDEDSSLTGVKVVDQDDGWNAAKNPYNFALYIQDKFEWEGLVINAGLRYDYLNVNTYRLKNEAWPLDPDSLAIKFPDNDEYTEEAQKLTLDDLEDAEAEQRISPRLGIGFPVTDKTVFHLYYGKFFQRPELQYLYVSYDYLFYMIDAHPYFNPIGNPNLEPEETTAYEVGVTHQLGDNSRFDITAYYKDIRNLTQVDHVPVDPFAYDTYTNKDYGTIKGLEFAFKLRRTNNIALDVAYTLSKAQATGSFASTQNNVAWTNSEEPLRISPLDFDQRHKLTAVVDVRSGAKEGPMLGNFYPLERAGLNLVFNTASGNPYTPAEIYNEVTLGSVTPTPLSSINSRYGPWTYRIDLKANKTFTVAGLDMDVYLWILNVLNTENAIDVFEGTGRPDDTGWLATGEGQAFINTHSDPDPVTGMTGEEMYQFKQNDPNSYDLPRVIRLGVRLSF